MKLVQVDEIDWVLDDYECLAESSQYKKNNEMADEDKSYFQKSIDDFMQEKIQQAMETGSNLSPEDLMLEFMQQMPADFMMNDNLGLPETDYETIMKLHDTQGYETALQFAQKRILENKQDPEAYFNLAYLCENIDNFLALMASRECLRLYFQAIPNDFDWNKHQIPWGALDNRPLLRAMYQLANIYALNGETEQAVLHAIQLLKVCPIDNLGMREQIIGWCMKNQQYELILSLASDYVEDMIPDIVYAETLVHCYHDNFSKAEKAWDKAEEILPNVAKELLKKRHPRPKDLDVYGVSIGGKEQAYWYWTEMGHWWTNNETAQKLIEKKRDNKSNNKSSNKPNNEGIKRGNTILNK